MWSWMNPWSAEFSLIGLRFLVLGAVNCWTYWVRWDLGILDCIANGKGFQWQKPLAGTCIMGYPNSIVLQFPRHLCRISSEKELTSATGI